MCGRAGGVVGWGEVLFGVVWCCLVWWGAVLFFIPRDPMPKINIDFRHRASIVKQVKTSKTRLIIRFWAHLSIRLICFHYAFFCWR